MKDIFKNYHRHKVLSHLWILSFSLMLAISINMFALSWATGDSFKASVIDSKIQTSQKDIKVTYNSWSLVFSALKDMKQVEEISLALAYNPNWLDILEPKSTDSDSSGTTLKNEDGFYRYIHVSPMPRDIENGDEIFSIPTTRLLPESQRVNFVEANFTDSDGMTYLLVLEWISF